MTLAAAQLTMRLRAVGFVAVRYVGGALSPGRLVLEVPTPTTLTGGAVCLLVVHLTRRSIAERSQAVRSGPGGAGGVIRRSRRRAARQRPGRS